MELLGTVEAGRPLLVVAVRLEADHLGTDLPVLITGMGKVNAALGLGATLGAGPRPSEVINLGTAGGLRPGVSGTHVVGTVMQHDLDGDVLFKLTGEVTGPPLLVGDPAGPVLATGDAFINDDAARDALARDASLVDMEGYAVAAAAQQFGVPVRLVKHVSDDAGAGAAKSWRDSVADCSRLLGAWLAEHR
ncbi:nucleosidase [Symbioplanes lichenis]|uniref:nucleosidase n=1 Tax=Symbioplanes lichenis TaxID=1629072 RepID=UPI002738BA08|nr:nucleosidase [Actinoplanes lichenis]